MQCPRSGKGAFKSTAARSRYRSFLTPSLCPSPGGRGDVQINCGMFPAPLVSYPLCPSPGGRGDVQINCGIFATPLASYPLSLSLSRRRGDVRINCGMFPAPLVSYPLSLSLSRRERGRSNQLRHLSDTARFLPPLPVPLPEGEGTFKSAAACFRHRSFLTPSPCHSPGGRGDVQITAACSWHGSFLSPSPCPSPGGRGDVQINCGIFPTPLVSYSLSLSLSRRERGRSNQLRHVSDTARFLPPLPVPLPEGEGTFKSTAACFRHGSFLTPSPCLSRRERDIQINCGTPPAPLTSCPLSLRERAGERGSIGRNAR